MNYVLEVVCDHTRKPAPPDDESKPPPRVVARIAYFPRPVDGGGIRRFGWLEWREIDLQDGQPPAMQTYFGEARRLGRTTGDVRDLVPGMGGQRWRFWCADCDDTLPARHSKAGPVFDQLRHARVPSVTLAGLEPRLAK